MAMPRVLRWEKAQALTLSVSAARHKVSKIFQWWRQYKGCHQLVLGCAFWSLNFSVLSTNIQFFVFGAKSHRMLSHQLTLGSYIHELYESSTQRKTYANYGLIMTDKCYKRHYWEAVQFQRRPVQVQLAKVRASRHWNATAAWKDSCQSKLMALTPEVEVDSINTSAGIGIGIGSNKV